MGQDLVINGTTYPGVESLELTTSDGEKVLYFEEQPVEELLKPVDLPDYVKMEVSEVASRVRQVLQDDSIVSITASDTHYPGDGASYSDEYQTNESTPHLCMAIKALGYLLPLDFIAHLGDIGRGDKADSPDALKKQNTDFLAWFKEAVNEIPVFVSIGNHDSGIYFHSEQTDGAAHTVSGDWLYQNHTALAASENTVFAGEEYGGYGYRDFPTKKLRVFFLNTSEQLIAAQEDAATLESQRTWFSTALDELNAKTDAAEWKWLILSHYPADYGATMPLSVMLKNYMDAENPARFLCQFHGHVHNFLADKLSIYENGSKVQYDGRRLCVPNGQYNRENYYTTIGAYPDINFAESQNWPKTPDTAEDTAFTVNVINPSEEVIYSFCYGAGYDRVVGIAATVYYSISKSLTNAAVSSDVTSVEEGGAFTATISANDGYDLSTVKVTMGGVDVTSTVYSNGTISIASVTGNVVITAVAVKRVNYTNLVDLAVNSSGASAPYTDGTYLSSSGSTSAMSGFVTTGFIPIDGGESHLYRIGGNGIAWNEYGARISWYDATFAKKGDVMSYDKIGSSQYYPVAVEDANAAAAFQTNANVLPPKGAAYFRVSAKGSGANLIITIDEPIE